MATETATYPTDAAGNRRIPGLEDLLRTPPEFRNRKVAHQAAGNALESISQGVRAIGELLWQAADSANEIDRRTQHGIGVLLIHLADFQMQHFPILFFKFVRQCRKRLLNFL